MTAEYINYIAVILTVVALSSIVQLFFLFFNIKNKKVNTTSTISTFQKTIDDLDHLVQRKCYNAYQRVLKPYVNKSLKTTPLINDKVVNEIAIQITNDVLKEMSDSYRNQLEQIYNKDRINDIILELVYNTVTEMALNINKRSINNMNFITKIENITKNDF